MRQNFRKGKTLFLLIVKDMINILLYKYIYFHANVYKYSLKVLQEKRYIIKQQVKQRGAQTWNK